MRLTLAILTVLAIGGIAAAQHICRGRAVAVPYVVPYAPPVYHAPAVVKVVKEHEVVVKAVKVLVQPDYYYSVSDGYRDSVLADAIAFRVLQAQALGLGKAPAESGPLPRYREPAREPVPGVPPAMPPAGEPAAKTAVAPALLAVMANRCARCHNGPGKNGIDLSEAALAATPRGQRWHAYALANSGEMPKGGQAIPDDEVREIYAWAKSAK